MSMNMHNHNLNGLSLSVLIEQGQWTITYLLSTWSEYEWVVYMVCLLPDATLYPFNGVSSTLPVDPANVIMVPVVAEFVIWTLIDIGS